ncbi:unnamed protein product [Chironomus riparius]|uniref:G-protein coupled receptors family 1 profile domain-containing protein n=1 Tax=Chironomus riparius TaxID=315576 RepID=A0A9N9S7R1_9DIPT|nr:unnamed protein product [Chironomus riparius]
MSDYNTEEVTHNDGDILSYGVKITFIVMEVIIAILAVTGNLAVIIAFIKEPKLRRQTNYYIISLVGADFLVGAIGIPLGIIIPFTDLPLSGVSFCPARIALLISFCNISILSLVVISIKRFIILQSANEPQNDNMSTKIFFRDISLCWIVGIVVGFIPIFAHQEPIRRSCMLNDVLGKYLVVLRFIFLIVVPVFMLSFIYFKIYRIIRSQIKSERTLKGSKCNELKLMRREVRATRTISLIVLIFMFSWIPVHIVYILPVITGTSVNKNILAFVVNLAHSNSAINPFLYAYHMKDIRHAIIKRFAISSVSTSVPNSYVNS